jgi:hypothetical protein
MTNPLVDEELEEALALVGEDLTREEWERHRALGRGERVEDLLSDFADRAAATT